MLRKILIMLAIVSVPLVMTGCGGYEEPEQGPIKKAPRPQQQAQAQAPKQEKKPLTELAANSRNPFQSHLLTEKPTVVREKVKGPLECCEIDLFRVMAMVVAGKNSYALVLAPSGKRYVVRIGDVMGAREGKIVSIDSRGVTVREQMRAADGTVLSSNDVVLALQKTAPKDKR